MSVEVLPPNLKTDYRVQWGDLRALWTPSNTCAACASWEGIRFLHGSALGKSDFRCPIPYWFEHKVDYLCLFLRVSVHLWCECIWKGSSTLKILVLQVGYSPVARQREVHSQERREDSQSEVYWISRGQACGVLLCQESRCEATMPVESCCMKNMPQQVSLLQL